MQAFKIRHFRSITRFDKCFETGLNQCSHSTTEYGLLAKQVCLGFFAKVCFDNTRSTAAITSVIKTGGLPDAATVGLLAGKVLLFFLIAGAIGAYLFPWVGQRLRAAHVQEFEFSALLIAALAYSLLAEALGMHFILGAFLAGLFFVHRTIEPAVYDSIRSSLTSWTMGFFAPLFFASIGLHLNLAAATEIPLFLTVLVLSAFFGKLLGAGLPALAMGFPLREALGIGTAMSARGAVELIIAGIALQAGLFRQPDPTPPEVAYLFSAVVIMALVTTLITPLVLRPLLGAKLSKS